MSNLLPEPQFGTTGNPWARAVAKLLLSTARAAENAAVAAKNAQSSAASASSRITSLSATILAAVATAISTAIAALTLSGISGNLDQSRITSTWTKDVSATNVGATTGTFTQVNVGGLTSSSMYSNLITPGTVRDIQIRSDGVMGYVASSERFKSDIAVFRFDDPKIILALNLVSYYYTADPNKRPDVGVIAEQVHALGFWWLVDYDDDWKPFGFKYAKLALAILPYLANVEARLSALEAQSTQTPEPSAST